MFPFAGVVFVALVSVPVTIGLTLVVAVLLGVLVFVLACIGQILRVDVVGKLFGSGPRTEPRRRRPIWDPIRRDMSATTVEMLAFTLVVTALTASSRRSRLDCKLSAARSTSGFENEHGHSEIERLIL
jgi:hypothetical protein